MKKIIIYLATMLLAAMTFTGCYDLETYPGDKVNEGTFYKTSDHAHQGLMGIYGMLRLNEAYGYQFCFDHLGERYRPIGRPFMTVYIVSIPLYVP